MAVKHRKMGPKRGNEALAAVHDDLKKTMAAIKEEEEFEGEANAAANRAELADTFPAARAVLS